jgi:nucleoid DNA-binding protein
MKGMESIDVYISELLFEHDCVILPGFGGFLTNYSGARIHPVRHSFHPPARTVVFNAGLQTNDGLLISYVAKRRNISYQESFELIKAYTAQCMAGLRSGQAIRFMYTGSFRMGRENNLVFEPEAGSNFLPDAFGLSSFVSPAISRESIRQRLEKQLSTRPAAADTQKERKLLPALRWVAAISIPIAAAFMLYYFNPTVLDDFGRSYSGMMPPLRFEGGAPAREAGEVDTLAEFMNFKVIPPKAEMAVAPAESHSALPAAPPPPALKKYQIVVGAFSTEENALNYVDELRARDFDAAIIGNSSNGLTRVSIAGLDTRSEALSLLAAIRREENPAAWLLIIK